MSGVAQNKKTRIPGFVGRTTPITVDHGEGAWVYGTDGSKWLDFCMGIAVADTAIAIPGRQGRAGPDGQNHPAQMNMYLHQPMMDLADTLCEIVPGNFDQALFANSGAEAVENAVKLAEGTLRRPGVIAFQNAFHGRTHLAMALTDSVVHYRGHMQPLVPCVFHARDCDLFHTRQGSTRPSTRSKTCAAFCAPRSTANTWPASWSSRCRARAASSAPTPEFFHECARSPTRSAPTS